MSIGLILALDAIFLGGYRRAYYENLECKFARWKVYSGIAVAASSRPAVLLVERKPPTDLWT